jgi:hypothetical protein
MNNKRCSVDQRINGQRTYQRTTEVVPSSGNNPYTVVEGLKLKLLCWTGEPDRWASLWLRKASLSGHRHFSLAGLHHQRLLTGNYHQLVSSIFIINIIIIMVLNIIRIIILTIIIIINTFFSITAL